MLDLNPVEANLLSASSNFLLPDTNQLLQPHSELLTPISPQKSLALKATDEAELFNQKLAALPLASTTTTSPDLIISSATIPTSAAAGNSIFVGYTELNLGGSLADSHYIDFFLSTDNVFSSNDTLLGFNSLSSLAAGSSSSGSKQLTLNSNLASGTYYLFLKADGADQITESSETNNLFSQAITVTSSPLAPDLIISSATIPTSIIAGRSFSVGYTEFNRGGNSANSHYIDFFLSTDNVFSANDTLLGYNYLSPLTAGSSSSGSKQLTLNSSLASGTYYLFLKADGINQVTESNEANNLFSQAITVTSAPPLSDLIISSATIPTTGTLGSTINVDYTEKNSGPGSAASHSLGFYLSTDNVFSSNDLLLGQNTLNSLVAGQSSSGSKTLTLSNSLTSGNYYLFIKADSGNQIVESNESNNLFSQAITLSAPPQPKSDLSMRSITTFSGAMVVGILRINYEEINQGSGTAGAHAVNIYLSTDDQLGSSDLLLGSSPVNSLAAGASTGAVYAELPLSSNLTPGNYYVIFKADGNEVISETNETNNLMKQLITINPPLPDLQITQITNLTLVNNLISFNYTETNQGIAQAGQHTTQFYLSTDYSLSSDDLLIGDSPSPLLEPGATYSNFKNFTINQNLTPGTYYLIAKADGLNEVTEINEGNNVRSAGLDWGMAKSDLIIESATIPSSVLTDSYFDISYSEKNSGNTSASAHFIKIYLSTNDSFSNDDLFLGESFVKALEGGASYADTKPIFIKSYFAPGTYYLILQADGNKQVAESNETNNVYTQMLTLLSAAPAQSVILPLFPQKG